MIFLVFETLHITFGRHIIIIIIMITFSIYALKELGNSSNLIG